MIYSGDGVAKSVDYRPKEVYHSARGVRRPGRKSDTFHIIHRASSGSGEILGASRATLPSLGDDGRRAYGEGGHGRGLPH